MSVTTMVAKLTCWLCGHRRGKQVSMLNGMSLVQKMMQGIKTFRCPRCGQTWTRKARKAKVTA